MESSDNPTQKNIDSSKLPNEQASNSGRNGRKPQRKTAYDPIIGPSASLFDYGRLILRRKGIMLVAAVLGISLGLLVSVPRTPIYQAHTTLEIQGLNENLLNTRDVNPSAPSLTSSALEEIQTQIKIIKSDTLLSRVIKKFELPHAPAPLTRLMRWRNAVGITATAPGSEKEAAVAMAAQTLQVEVLQQAHIILITCDSTDPKVAADFGNILANEFINQKLESRLVINQRTSEWLSHQLEDLKVNLEHSEEKLQSYAQGTGLMFTSDSESQESSSIAEQRLQQFQAVLSDAQTDRLTKQSKYEIAKSAPAESLPQVLDDNSLHDFQTKLTELRSQLAELSVSLTPEHYRVQKIQAQINELGAAFDRERANILKRIANEYDDATRRVELLSQEYQAQTKFVSGQASKVAHYGILKREVETSRQLYEGMLQHVKEYGIASAITANNVRVVDPAVPPSGPYKPDIYLYTMLGLATGVFLGILLIIRQEHVDRSIHAPGDAPSYLNVPELGVVLAAGSDSTLELPARSAHVRSLDRVIAFSKRFAAGDLLNRDGSAGVRNTDAGKMFGLTTWEKPFSLFAECFRTTAASILFSEQNGVAPQVIVITSANPQDGKSTTAANLAIALAETKRRVLLIDSDLRRPDLYRVFNMDNRWGLIDILQGDIGIDEYPLDMLARETMVPNVYLMSSGTVAGSVVHLLHSTRLPDLLRRLRREFDIILIDAPPVLQISDARVLGRISDGVVFVVRSANTTRDMAIMSCRRFREDRTRVVGTILNMWNPQDSRQEGYYQTYYQYYSPKEKETVGKS